MQHIVIYGFVGRDPELRYTPAGRAVADFSVAVNQGWIDRQSNARRSKTTWFKVTVWGARAEAVNSHVRKGMKVLVEGNVGVAAYMGQDGQPKATLELSAGSVEWASQSNGDGEDVSEIPDESDLPF